MGRRCGKYSYYIFIIAMYSYICILTCLDAIVATHTRIIFTSWNTSFKFELIFLYLLGRLGKIIPDSYLLDATIPNEFRCLT